MLFGTVNTGGGFGAFESSNTFKINYTPGSGGYPYDVGFTVYDDAYDGTYEDFRVADNDDDDDKDSIDKFRADVQVSWSKQC